MLVGRHFGGSHAGLQAVAEKVADQNQALRIAEGERTQKYTVDEREGAVVAPMPNARVRTTVTEKSDTLRSCRYARRRLFIAIESLLSRP